MELDFNACAEYFTRFTKGFPPAFEIQETNLNNLAYFCINALALLGKLDSLGEDFKKNTIEWVYSNQVHAPLLGGFRHSGCHETPDHKVEEMHLTMTFSSLAMLLILGDDLSRVEKDRVLEGVKALQLPSGSFLGHPLGSEDDIRFVFCAAAICRMLGSNGDVDVEKAIEYTLSCQTYEGGFAHEPGDEAHGGATYCAISALSLWGALDRIKDRRMLAYWLSQRQDDGFNGRTHKLTDTCYSFWIGAPLTVLGWFDDIVDKERLISFIFSNYAGKGSFRSNSTESPDVLHTHFSLVGLSLAGYPGLEKIDPRLGFVAKGLPDYITA